MQIGGHSANCTRKVNGLVGGNHTSQSQADYRLCSILAYWIGPDDEDRIASWFMSSPLADNIRRHPDPDDYLQRTIIAAIGSRHYFYDPEYNSATPTVRNALTDRRMFVLDYTWTGRSGPTDRDVYRALLHAAWKYGVEHGNGIRVAVSLRDLTLEAGLGSINTTQNAIQRLIERHSLVSVLASGGKRRASTYLLTEVDPKVTHKRTVSFYVSGSGQELPITMKIRNVSRNYGTLGKRNGEIIDLIHAASERPSLDKLAQRLGVRKNHLKARNIKPLLEEGFIVGDEQGYGLPEDIEDRLRAFLEDSGSNEAERRVRQRIDIDRDGYNHQKERKNVQSTYGYQNDYDPAIHDALDAMDVFHAIECTYSLTCDCPKCYMDTMMTEAEEMEVAA